MATRTLRKTRSSLTVKSTLTALLLLTAAACVPNTGSSGTQTPRPRPARTGAATPSPPASAAPAILSAQLARPGPLHGTREDGFTVTYRVYLVFNTELAPASLWPDRFLVMLENGARLEPMRASLAPASERDEQRTVALDIIASVTPPDRDQEPEPKPEAQPEAQPEDPSMTKPDAEEDDPAWAAAIAETKPRAITLSGALHSETGVIIKELSSAVAPADRPVQLAAALQLPVDDTRCPGAAQVIRTYWTTPVTTISPAAAVRSAIWLTTRDGRRVNPTRLDDLPQTVEASTAASTGAETDTVKKAVALVSGYTPADNVVDLCLAESSPALQLEIAAGLFRGAGIPANPMITHTLMSVAPVTTPRPPG